MDIEKVQQIVASMIDEKLTATEKEEAKAEMEAALLEAQAKLDELSEALQARSEEVASLTGELDAAKTDIEEKATAAVELQEKLEGLTTSVEEKEKTVEELQSERESASEKSKELEEELTSLKKTLEDIEKAKRLDARLKELAAAKVLRTGEKLDAQTASVTEMDDETFASYKEDLISLRQEFASTSEEGTGGRETAGAAPLDIENIPSDDVKETYRKMGEALANKAKNRLR